MNNDVSKSFFCVFSNPEEHGYTGTPQEIVDNMISAWVKDNPQRTCAISYCISAQGLKHCHAVLEDTKAMRYSAIQKVYAGIHIEPTKGNKSQAEAYINKKKPFDEQGEQVIYSNRHGDIKACQGQRNDLGVIEELLQLGKNPNEIMDMSISYRRHYKLIRDAYFRKRYKETPTKRELFTYWHTGNSGTGKSYTEVKLKEIHGEDNIYKVSQFETGFLDNYCGEPIIFIDELRGQIKYSQLLIMLDSQKHNLHARFANVIGLWREAHITSVYPPEILYKQMINNNSVIDTYEQLRRRITYIVYHYIDIDGKYCSYEMPMKDYINYEHLKKLVEKKDEVLTPDEYNPFIDTNAN